VTRCERFGASHRLAIASLDGGDLPAD
jgi:hypothetical protein